MGLTYQGVWIIDSSALIRAKQVLPAARQWPIFGQLEQLVEQGRLLFPKQVTDELNQERHIDIPEAWATAVCVKVIRSYEPSVEYLQQVMAVAGDVIDADAEGDPGDPWVLAQALELAAAGYEVCIVTEDRIDHLPLRIAMTSACERLGLEHCGLLDFLREVGLIGTQ